MGQQMVHSPMLQCTDTYGMIKTLRLHLVGPAGHDRT